MMTGTFLLNNCDHTPFGNRLDLGCGERRKINELDGLYAPRKVNVVLIQIVRQHAHRTTFAGSMSNEDDFVRRYQGSGHLSIEGRFFGRAIALIVSLLAMNQMVMVAVGVIGRDGLCIPRSALTEIAKNMCCMVIDNDDHPTRLNELLRR